ncbi:ABC transporter ATP-binding protein [Aliishimia ponticola]|uniref:ABC transporter ATP-binding protein n=1 Tax=Aliishimia ponticola TaxID=2499833 RepID=A0A4S4N7U8_9RHOB|nr:ABC transporter ATP-binding protein [Aliishimia ponticola]THH34397.1 ABC transporter ATP-binding protein [Aliishimia ponticola]
MTDKMLDIRNLKVALPTERGTLNAVRGVDLSIAKGETLCLVGESGCGKSLTATALMGLLPRYAKVTADRFEMAGQDLTAKTDAKLAKMRGRDVAMIFQDPTSALNPTLTIGRQLTEGVMRAEKLSRKEADARAIEMLDRVGIANPAARLTQYPHGFSGGQRQRIMIASALMGRPKLLIADEPTTALDVTIQAQILALLGELQADLGLSLLLITHDLGVVAAIATEVAVMYAGRIAERAPVKDLFRAPQHPYTQGLLAAIPVPGLTPRGSALPAIPGRVPGLIGTMTGCAFRDRCALAGAECSQDPVPRHSPAPGRFVECYKAAEVAA